MRNVITALQNKFDAMARFFGSTFFISIYINKVINLYGEKMSTLFLKVKMTKILADIKLIILYPDAIQIYTQIEVAIGPIGFVSFLSELTLFFVSRVQLEF